MAHEALPMLRSLVVEYPQDPMYRDLTDQFMLGGSLLAAPVMTPGVTARAVYLPKGTWFGYYTGKRFKGGRYVIADAPVDRIPLFAKAGAIIPVSVGKPQSVQDIDGVELEVFPGCGSFVHYSDDGQSMDYLRGGIHRLGIRVRGKELTQTVLEKGCLAQDTLTVRFLGE